MGGNCTKASDDNSNQAKKYDKILDTNGGSRDK